MRRPNRYGRRVRRAAAIAALGATAIAGAIGATAAAAPTCTDTFTGPSGGLWQTAANWTTASNMHAVPGAGDVACWSAGTIVVSDAAATADSVQGGSLTVTAGTLALASSTNDSTVQDLALDGTGDLTATGQTTTVTGSFEWGAGTASPQLDAKIVQTGGGSFTIDGSGGLGGPDFTGGTISTTSPVSIENQNFSSTGAESLTTTSTITLGANLQLSGLDPSTTFTATGLASQTGNYGFWDAGLVLTGGTTTVPVNGNLEVGTIAIEGGTFVQDGGTTLGGGGLNSTTLTGGTLTGVGDMGNVTNESGTVTVPTGSAGDQLTIDGTYAQQAGGTLAVTVNGTDTSLLALNGTGGQTIGGTLSLSDAPGYTPPSPGSAVADIVLSNSAPITGTFASLSGPAASEYTPQYASQVVTLYAASGKVPVLTGQPVITGTPAPGNALTCNPGTWSPTPTAYAYTWSRNGTTISGATHSTYTVATADEGTSLTCTVIASDPAGPSAPATSAPVLVPTPGPPTTTPPAGSVPVNVTPPTISGTPTPGHTLRCSTGSWTHDPTSYAYRWRRNGTATAAATSAYPVAIADEAADLTCTVTAANPTGPGIPATSAGTVIAEPGTLNCPKPTGRITGTKIGPLGLGLSRGQARHRLKRYVVTHNDFDNFCLYGGWGIRVGYPSSRLMRTLPAARRFAKHVVLGLTANPYYALRGVRPGMSLRSAAHALHVGRGFRIGTNTWYLAPDGVSRAVLKVRGGIIQEVGIANRRLTSGSRATQQRFLASFKAG